MPALDAETPTSQSASISARRRRAVYGAPEAPVIPRKMRTEASAGGLRAPEPCNERQDQQHDEPERHERDDLDPRRPLFRSCALALGRLEEGRQLLEILIAEARERRHWRARIHARRALQVLHLEVDPA